MLDAAATREHLDGASSGVESPALRVYFDHRQEPKSRFLDIRLARALSSGGVANSTWQSQLRMISLDTANLIAAFLRYRVKSVSSCFDGTGRSPRECVYVAHDDSIYLSELAVFHLLNKSFTDAQRAAAHSAWGLELPANGDDLAAGAVCICLHSLSLLPSLHSVQLFSLAHIAFFFFVRRVGSVIMSSWHHVIIIIQRVAGCRVAGSRLPGCPLPVASCL